VTKLASTAEVDRAIAVAVGKSDIKLRTLVVEKFGEVVGRLNALDPEKVFAKVRDKAAERFRFASERDPEDDIPELPNFLPARAIN
jgi:hypothetical protein